MYTCYNNCQVKANISHNYPKAPFHNYIVYRFIYLNDETMKPHKIGQVLVWTEPDAKQTRFYKTLLFLKP